MASGYILRPDANGADLVAFTDGWFRSRDRAFIREDGVVFLAAREDDVINIGGNKVDPAVIENAIAQAPGVIECAVVPAPRANGSVALVAVVVAQGDFDPAALKQHCREMLPKPLVPHAFVRAPSLPRNEGGKVLRSEVASRLAPGRAEQPGQ
jgi:acyl-coenzyme A synthetase/AMP-(fatty) acid ligase